MRRYLIIRQKERGRALQEFLQGQNCEVFVEEIFAVKGLRPQVEGNYAILTSANAILGFLAANLPKNVRIFAVGEATAEVLRENGYNNILVPREKSVLALEKLILAQKIAKNEKILYFCGNFVTKKLDLAQIEEVLVYKIHYFEEFSPEFLAAEGFDCVLLYSKNAVKNFSKLIKKHNLLEKFKKTVIMGFSEEIVAEIERFGWQNCGNFEEDLLLKKFYKL